MGKFSRAGNGPNAGLDEEGGSRVLAWIATHQGPPAWRAYRGLGITPAQFNSAVVSLARRGIVIRDRGTYWLTEKLDAVA